MDWVTVARALSSIGGKTDLRAPAVEGVGEGAADIAAKRTHRHFRGGEAAFSPAILKLLTTIELERVRRASWWVATRL